MIRRSSLLALFALFFSQQLSAIPFEEMNIKPGERIGIYLGTFNPITLGHQETIDFAVKSGMRVVIIPRDIILHKSGTYPYRTRLGLVESVYADNPNVGYPTKKYWLPNLNGISRAIKKQKGTIIGIVGQDILESTKYSWLNTTVMFGRVDEWLMAERGNDPNFKPPEKFAGKMVKSLSDLVDVSERKFTDASSTKARNTLASRPDFYTAGVEINQQDLPLDARVKVLVRKQVLFAPEEVLRGNRCKDLENQIP